jgi:hypothetical protein
VENFRLRRRFNQATVISVPDPLASCCRTSLRNVRTQRDIMNPVPKTTPPPGVPCVEIAVVYEDEGTRQRAQRICDALSADLEPDFQCHLRWWRVDHLRDVILHHESAEAAARADMLVLSVHAGGAFPAWFDEWVDNWACHRKPGPGALVGLVGTMECDHQRVTPRHDLLRRVAARAGMDYLPEGIWERSPRHDLGTARLNQRRDEVSPVLQQILTTPHASVREWGINE